jgi:hypothetical protein
MTCLVWARGNALTLYGVHADPTRPHLAPIVELPVSGEIHINGILAFSRVDPPEPGAPALAPQDIEPRMASALLAALPLETDSVSPMMADCPFRSKVIAACMAKIGKPPERSRNFFRTMARSEALDFLCRSGRLSNDDVFELLRPPADGAADVEPTEFVKLACESARRQGHAIASVVFDECEREYNAEQSAIQRAAQRIASAQAKANKKHLFRGSWICLNTMPSAPYQQHSALENARLAAGFPPLPAGRTYFRADGLPCGSDEIPCLPGMYVSRVSTLEGTEQDRIAADRPLPDYVSSVLLDYFFRNVKREPRREEQFEIRGETDRTPGRLFAFQLLRSHADLLVPLLMSGYGDTAVLAGKSLFGLPLAYFPKVSIATGTFAIQQALTDYVQKRFGNTYRELGGGRQEKILTPPAWPMGLPKPESVRASILRECCDSEDPPVWTDGQMLRNATPEERKEIELQLDPSWHRTLLAKLIGDKKTVLTKDIYAGLAAEGAIESENPGAPTRSAISGLLESVFGFRRYLPRRGEDGKRSRVWVRENATADAMAEARSAEDAEDAANAAPGILDAATGMREPLPMQAQSLVNSEGTFDR